MHVDVSDIYCPLVLIFLLIRLLAHLHSLSFVQWHQGNIIGDAHETDQCRHQFISR